MTSTSIQDVFLQSPVSNSLATVGTLAWFWLPYVEQISSGAAVILPIVSVAWLLIQIWSHFRKGK